MWAWIAPEVHSKIVTYVPGMDPDLFGDPA